MNEPHDYSAASIQVLQEWEAVRKRPGMYVGSTGGMGIAHLVFELVSNALQEHVAGHARNLWVQTGPAGITVGDDGRGFPLETVAGIPRIGDAEQYHPTRHQSHFGIGFGAVTALSSVLVLTSDRARRYQQVFVQGQPATPVHDVGPPIGRGTTVHLVPDTGIFGDARLPVQVVRKRLEELAMLNPELSMALDGAIVPSHGGLLGVARRLAGDAIRDELRASGTFDGVQVELAVVWGDGEAVVRAYANQLDSEGAHLDGLLDGLEGTDERGRVALISVVLPAAMFQGRSRRILQGDSVRAIVRDVVRTSR